MDLRCKNCDRRLAIVEVIVAAIKCPKCKMIFEYKVMSNHINITSEYTGKDQKDD